MSFFWDLLDLIGGLAMFLFGMSLMGEGLERRAGSNLKALLGRATAGRIRGFLLGAGATAAIQSSSAVTVMLIGFVNSGLMTLRQAIGVIMGANVGTTVTSWLLSLTGIRGGSFLLQLFKPTSFTALLALIGVWFYVFSKENHRRINGLILLGFTVLIYGMERMSDAVKPLADLPEFGEILLVFGNPLFGVLAGAILTAIIQSSSASIGILQALAATGQVTFATAIPIIMGQNIGTCATTLLSTIGTGVNAKRTALAHLYFNLIGTLLILVGFYAFDWIFHFSFLSDPVNAFSVAAVHSFFNVFSAIILVPFASSLEKLVMISLPERAKRHIQRPYNNR